MDKEKLHLYASNQLSEKSEVEEVIQWIESSSENQKEYNTIKNLLAYSEFANFDELVATSNQTTRKTKLIRMEFMKYAAIFILSFLIGGSTIYFLDTPQANNFATNEIIVPLGESAEVILSDNTHVWLNSGAHMKYPTTFNSNNRDVELKGEAFFDVTHNPDQPFHVITPAITVEVLGTSFNVMAIENQDEVNVTLVDGKVNLQNEDGTLLAELKPSQNASYNLNKKEIDIETVNVEFYTSWKNGVLMFKDEKLVDLSAKLERWYNVEIVFDDELVKELEFSGTILKNKPIDQILDILKFTSEIDYNISMKSEQASIIHLKRTNM